MSEILTDAEPTNPWWFLVPGLVWVTVFVGLVLVKPDGFGAVGTASSMFMLVLGLFSIMYGLKLTRERWLWQETVEDSTNTI